MKYLKVIFGTIISAVLANANATLPTIDLVTGAKASMSMNAI